MGIGRRGSIYADGSSGEVPRGQTGMQNVLFDLAHRSSLRHTFESLLSPVS